MNVMGVWKFLDVCIVDVNGVYWGGRVIFRVMKVYVGMGDFICSLCGNLG